MGKQLEFSKQEQNIITESINRIAYIMLQKQCNGVKSPELEGEVTITDIKKSIKFNFILE